MHLLFGRVRYPSSRAYPLVSQLFDAVRGHLRVPTTPFKLYVAPPQKFLDPVSTFWSADLAPASIVYIQGDLQPPYLNDEISKEIRDYPMVEDAVVDAAMAVEEVAGEGDLQAPRVNRPDFPSPKTDKKLPKWFRGGPK
jgi:hypothetical protein